jgi:hypothetical protein
LFTGIKASLIGCVVDNDGPLLFSPGQLQKKKEKYIPSPFSSSLS